MSGDIFHTPSRITIHCSATRNGDNSINADWIRRIHIQERGFKDIGYHLVIKCDGEVERGRPFNMVGAHVESENTGNLGICLIGTDKFSKAQFASLRYYLDGIFLTYNAIPKWGIGCHYEAKSAQRQGKTCPNMDVHRVYVWYHLKDDAAIMPYLME
jgi:N-acetylmuramoyl-L-alanine amidase